MKKSDELTYYEDAWQALGRSPGESQNLRIRSHAMIALREIIKERGLTQAQAGKLFGVSQPRVSDLTRGHIERFSVDALIEMLARAGFRVELKLALAA